MNTLSNITPKGLSSKNIPIIKINQSSAKPATSITSKISKENLLANKDDRLNEYSNLFNIINGAMTDLKSSFNEILIQNKNRRSFIGSDLSIIKENFGFIEPPKQQIIEVEEELKRGPTYQTEDGGCDFSETCMFENVIVKQPDLYRSKLNFFDRRHHEDDKVVIMAVDNTYVEYESMLTEENNLQNQGSAAANLKRFNQAKINLIHR
jgi:hypothetical protein